MSRASASAWLRMILPALLSACQVAPVSSVPQAARPAARPGAAAVPKPAGREVLIEGRLGAGRAYVLRNQHAGWVRQLFLIDGQFVTQGQPLVKLDSHMGLASGRLTRSYVAAPAPGRISHILLTRSGSYLSRGAPVATLHDWSRVRATFRLPASLARDLAVGSRVPVRITELRAPEQRGVVNSITGPATGSAAESTLVVLLDNPGPAPAIRPGMHARIRLPEQVPLARSFPAPAR